MVNSSSALERFTILDLTRVRSGPTAVRQLADWGANVIKIEMPIDVKEKIFINKNNIIKNIIIENELIFKIFLFSLKPLRIISKGTYNE